MKPLSQNTVKNIGFDKIQESLVSLSKCEENYSYFRHLSPIKNQNELDSHLSLSDIIYQSLIRKEDVDISLIADMAKLISKRKYLLLQIP